MLNIHLNGDIVRCPDIAEIKKRAQEIREKHQICKYNYHEDTCAAWQNSLQCYQAVKKNNQAGNCQLSGTEFCPGHLRQKGTGNEKKQYRINNVNYRKMSSAAHDMVKSSQYKTLFITLTLPPFRSKHKLTKSFFYEEYINQAFSRFIENLRTNYSCNSYIAVRERGENSNRLHFHLLCSIPFTDFAVLNRAWCNAISYLCEFSKTALRTTPETLFIYNPGKALRYVCKYFAKSRGSSSETRILFMSNNLIKLPVKVYGSVQTILEGYKGIYINQTSDFSTCFRITNSVDFMRFCNEYLYNLFETEYNFPLFNPKLTRYLVPCSN